VWSPVRQTTTPGAASYCSSNNRAAKGYENAKDFAEKTGRNAPAYRKYERTFFRPIDTLQLMSEVTGMTLDFLIFCKPDADSPGPSVAVLRGHGAALEWRSGDHIGHSRAALYCNDVSGPLEGLWRLPAGVAGPADISTLRARSFSDFCTIRAKARCGVLRPTTPKT